MEFTETDLQGCFIIQPKIFEDNRGYFFESYRQNSLSETLGYDIDFIQDNESSSKCGVVRGLHIQRGKFAQSKLVRVLSGKILDVAVDVRKDSETFGQHISVELSGDNKKQLFIPKGFLHGFSVLSETAVVSYKCNAYYDQPSEDGCHPLDNQLNIDWKIPKEKMILSDKDLAAKNFSEFNPY